MENGVSINGGLSYLSLWCNGVCRSVDWLKHCSYKGPESAGKIISKIIILNLNSSISYSQHILIITNNKLLIPLRIHSHEA